MSDKDFDAKYYFEKYPDVRLSGLKPYKHYIKYGKKIGRSPCPDREEVYPLGLSKEISENVCKENSEYIKYVEHSLREYKKNNQKMSFGAAEELPLVSVVITSFNAEETIEDSIFSILNQTYPNVEVVVCDDHSTDSTWFKLQELEKRCRGLKVFRQNSNYGTYLAKNVAINNASGEFIAFQDSDDISHPERISVQVYPLIKNKDIVATRTKYLRYDDSSGKIIKVGGNESKFGLITLLVRSCVYNEIGYFDSVRKAGDDEFMQRIRHFYGREKIVDQNVTLYCALLRENSLVADMIKRNNDGSVEQNSSRERREYVRVFKNRYETKNKKYFLNNFPVFPLRSINTYPSSISALGRDATKVVVSLCSIPSRSKSLKKTIDSLKSQVDVIYLFLDGYESCPDFVKNNHKIRLIKTPEGSSPRDNAKFIPFNDLKKSLGEFYYFTCDDDIVYPADYVNTHIRSLKKFDNEVVLGVHGVVVSESPKSYFKNRFIYHFENDYLSDYALVNNLGTGTVAFHSSVIREIDVNQWPQGGMVDIFFGQLCYRENIPMIALPRHSGWLYVDPEAAGTPTLFSEFKTDKKEKMIMSVISEGCSKGYESIIKVIKCKDDELRGKLMYMLPDFYKSLSVSMTYLRYRK
ncbi:glycosyltransferase family 2 protein [Vreelandella venusta]